MPVPALVILEVMRAVVFEPLPVTWMFLDADAVQFGALMTASHASLRDDYAVSVPALDELVAALQIEKDVFGARLTGAGFGGCCVALVADGKASAIGRRITAQRSSSYVSKLIVP